MRARRWCGILFFWAVCGAVAAAVGGDARVEFGIGRVHGLVNFVETIHGDAHRSPVLRDIFDGSVYDNERTAGLLREFDEARRNLALGVSFEGYPLERRVGRNLSKLFLIQSAFARDLDDLAERTLGMLPQADHTRLFEALGALDEVYGELVWKPQRSRLETFRRRIARATRRWGIGDLFDAARTFYRAEWPEGMPFTVALDPLPGSSGVTSAESIGSLESVGVLVDERDLGPRFGVIFHEMCHSLWEAQPAAVQHEIERHFTASPSPYARLAYQQINEALATALGNGWAYERATGEPNAGSWYNDARVEGFSRGIHPVVVRYLGEGRGIDRAFVEEAVGIFAALFPHAIREYDLLLNKILLMTDGTSLPHAEIVDALQSHFRVSSISSSTPIDHERSLDTVHRTGETLVVVVSEEQEHQLAALAGVFPAIAERLDALLAEPQDFVHAALAEDGRAWIVIRAGDAAALGRAVARMHLLGRIDPDAPWIRLTD